VQYEVLKAGSGEPPRADDAVVISYQASFADGTVIDTSDDSESQHIPLDDIVVPGLKEALLLMNTGARWQVVVPPSMGFTRSGNRMLRRRDLIYDIMLVSIDRAQAANASD
jgi:FKBP-type peptidyl-prolyl cis-trans isomerase